MRPVSNRMQFRNRNLLPSGEAAVAGSGLGQLFGSGSWNRPLANADEDRRGYLVDEWYMGCNCTFFFIVSFGCATTGSKTEGRKLNDIYNGLLKVQIK